MEARYDRARYDLYLANVRPAADDADPAAGLARARDRADARLLALSVIEGEHDTHAAGVSRRS